jgi:Uncharacterised protein family (UPF0149)
MAAKKTDKRVYELRANDGARACTIAVSADSTLLDLHLALLGAFYWRGDCGVEERGAYRINFSRGAQTYTEGRGSRTRLRRLLAIGERFACTADDPRLVLDCEVLREYEVRSRRHHPKVIDVGGDQHDAKVATWHAQSAARREFRAAGRDEVLPPEYVHGMITAIVSGPMVMRRAWLPELMGASQYDGLEDAQRAVADVMNVYNTIAQQVHYEADAFVDHTARMLEAGGNGVALANLGARLRSRHGHGGRGVEASLPR